MSMVSFVATAEKRVKTIIGLSLVLRMFSNLFTLGYFLGELASVECFSIPKIHLYS